MKRVMFDQHNVSLGTCTGEVLDQLNFSLCSPCQDGGPHVSVNAATTRERQRPGSQQSRWSDRFGSIVWIDWFSAWGRFQPSAGACSASARTITARLPHPQCSHSPMSVDGPKPSFKRWTWLTAPAALQPLAQPHDRPLFFKGQPGPHPPL